MAYMGGKRNERKGLRKDVGKVRSSHSTFVPEDFASVKISLSPKADHLLHSFHIFASCSKMILAISISLGV